MVTLVREFSSVGELLKNIDELITEYRRLLGDVIRKLEETRIRSEQEKQLRALLSKFGIQETSRANEIELKYFKMIFNPTPIQEHASLESIAEAINNKITTLTALRKDLEALSGLDIKLKVVVVYVDDIPKTIMIKSD